VSLDHLTGLLTNRLKGCIVHFGSCSVIGADDSTITTFLQRSGASAVMGYDRDVEWIDSAAWELVLLGVLGEYRRQRWAIPPCRIAV